MSSSGASRISARSGDSADGTGTGGSGSERTSDDGHAGESNAEHNDSSSSKDDAQSQRDSEGEQGEPQESDAEDTASEEERRLDQDTDGEDAASNSSGRSGATDVSSAASEHLSNAGTENNDDGNNSGRKSSDSGKTSRRYPRESAEESETEMRGESGRSGSSKSGHDSSSDSDDDSEGAQNEEGDERRFLASDEDGEHSDRADENDVSSEGQQSHDEEERLRQEGPDGDDTEDDEQSDGDSLAGTKTNDDDDEGDDSGGEGGPDREEEVTAARRIQRRVRSRTTEARMDRDMQPQHKAATKIQATARGRHARRNRSNRDRFAGTKIDHDDVGDDSRSEGGSDQEEKATTARRIQRRVRSRTTKARADGDRDMKPRHKAATKIQATARGRHARRNRSNRDRFVSTNIGHDDDDDDDDCSSGEGGSDRQEKATAARKIQRRVRSRTTKARMDGGGDMQPHHKAATKIQATARGRHVRRHCRTRLGSVSSDEGSSDSGTNTNASRTVEGGTINRSTRNLGSPGTEEASAHESSDRADEDDANDGLAENERDCTSTDGLNLIEGDKLLEQHAARRIQRHAKRMLLGGEKEIRTQIPSKPSTERKRKSANRDTDDDDLRSMRVPTKPPERDTQGAARDGTGNRSRPACAGENGASRGKVPMGEDEAASCLQREARRGSASKKQQRGGVRGEVHGTHRKSEALGKDAAARCIQAQLRSGHARRCSREDRIERKSDGARRNEAGENTDGSLSHPPTSTARTEMNIRGHGLHPEKATRDVQLELTVEHLGAQQQQQPPGFVSPGKAAAAAASAVAKSAAAAAAAAVRAAEAAADAAEAAEAAAAEEEEWSSSVIISSPPVGRESRRKPSPVRSAFWLTEGDDKDGSQEGRNVGKTSKARPGNGDSGTVETAKKGLDGRGAKRSPRQTRGHAGAASDRENRGEVGGNGSGSEDAKLKHAREQAKRHARDRRARAMAKEEDSRRELRAMHADLVKAEELRNKQANAEKSALEAKRARVVDDMNRRQQRLQRIQQEEEALLDRGGHSHQRSSSRSSSADAAVESQSTRLGGGAGNEDDLTERAARDEGDSFSLPLISGGRDGGRQRRRKARHVSTFRERILEERRARKEVDALKRKELEEKHSRQTEYASKIRAQAKRALAAEQRRAQEDADRSARAHRSGQSVDRTPIAIKRPKQEGEWGVYSYPPDRLPDGFAATNGGVGGRGGGAGGFGRRPAPSYGSIGRVRDRLGSSELRDRMRREREKATGASRARAADARAAAVEAKAATGNGRRAYGSSEDGSGVRRRAGFRRDVGSDDGDEAVGNRRVEGEGVYRHHRPAPPPKQRGVQERLGYGQAWSGDVGGGDGGQTLGVARSGTKNAGGGAGTPDLQRHHPAGGGNNIHAMYEERLAALERRLVHASSGSRSFPEGREGGLAVGSDSSAAIERRGGGEGAPARKHALPLRNGGEWGTDNNPFGYRESPAEHGRGGFARRPDYGGAVNSGESTSGREVEVEGLSTMYMGPISHKMARLRATNKA